MKDIFCHSAPAAFIQLKGGAANSMVFPNHQNGVVKMIGLVVAVA